MRRTMITVAVLAAVGASLGRAQNPAPPRAGTGQGQGQPGAPARPLTDQEFAAQAAIGGLAEVEAANLALQRGSGAEVKQFARRMLDDHTKANRELMSLAASKQIGLPR